MVGDSPFLADGKPLVMPSDDLLAILGKLAVSFPTELGLCGRCGVRLYTVHSDAYAPKYIRGTFLDHERFHLAADFLGLRRNGPVS